MGKHLEKLRAARVLREADRQSQLGIFADANFAAFTAKAPARLPWAETPKTWDDLRRRIKADYDKQREHRPSGKDRASGPSGRRINDRPRQGGPFIAVDSEGVNIGPAIVRGKGKHRRVIQKQRTVLWMAGGAEGFEDWTLAASGVELDEGFGRETIWNGLLTLPRFFAGPNASDPAPIFVGFGFNYDVGQLVAGMSYKKAWELHSGVPWDKRDDDEFPESLRRWVLVGDCAISHIPRKSVVLCKLRNPQKPFRYSVDKKTGERRRAVDWIERIEIYDVHGFFQSSLLRAIEKFPGVVTPAELELIKEGKAKRGAFTADDLPMLKRYTAAELKALASMMEKLRAGFKYTDPATGEEKQLKIRHWWGAGAIAQALLKAFLGDRPTHILGDMSKPWLAIDAETGRETGHDAVDWVTYARFGGRIELCMQGVSHKAVNVFDLSSAYPAIAVTLPSMEGGKWVWKKNPTREEIENSNILSMFKVRTRYLNPKMPFYPLPFRTEKRSIMFPPEIVGGRYIRDDVVAAFQYFDHFMRDRALAHRGLYPADPQIIVSEALFFEPADPSSCPLRFILDLFDWRASLPKDDMRGQVIKLGINSVYGKFAQRVGRPGEPPAYASLWYAAAITAGTRRKLMEAALTDPSAIIAFATDAVFSTRSLPIPVPDRKVLGEWEFVRHDAGSFVQSGVYSMRDIGEGGKLKIKAASRGFAPKQEQDEMGAAQDFVSALDQDLFVDVPQIWRDGGDVLNFEDDEYIGLGRAVVSPKTWLDIGSWKTYDRELKLNSMSAKRRVPQGSKRLQSRADKLIALEVEPYTFKPRLGLTGMLAESDPAIPDWHWAAKVKRGRAPAGDGGADDENVNAGLDANFLEA